MKSNLASKTHVKWVTWAVFKCVSNSDFLLRPLSVKIRGWNEKKLLWKLVNYRKNVYPIERGLNKVTDRRVNPTYKISQVITLVLFGFPEQNHGLNLTIKANEFKKIWLMACGGRFFSQNNIYNVNSPPHDIHFIHSPYP